MTVIRCALIWAITGVWSMVVCASDIVIERISRPANASSDLLIALARYEASQNVLLRECRQDIRRSKESDPASASRLVFQLRYEVLWDTDHYFSIVDRRTIFCDGPYTVFSEQGLTFDKGSGRKYDSLRLYRLNYRNGHPFPEVSREVRELVRESLIKARGVTIKDDDFVKVLKQDEIWFLD